MPIILPVRGIAPQFGDHCWLADNATVTGDVVCGEECTFWFQSVVRGDVNKIRLGKRVNVQDGAIVHCTYQKTETTIGENVSIGHRAIVHGCTVGNNVLIGMGAIVMDRAVIPDRVLIAAGAVVTEGKQLESGWIYAGTPARKLKPLSEAQLNGEIARIAAAYVKYAGWYVT